MRISRFFETHGTVVGFAIMSAGVVAQIAKTTQRGNVADISGWEVAARFLASLLVFYKTVRVGDRWLVVGAALFVLTYAVYAAVFTWAALQ